MTEKHITNNRDRKSQKYRDLHKKLEREVYDLRIPDKQTRKKVMCWLFRQQAES